ncbi:Hypp4599 [Branchiostoma lanceolatum]|uniref:Hypp4599 protein n=1 Tax=Branchiostoma lanceolatum TaxID=7740 RepID=A0A8K0F1I5_BRALA|nr:Hypp4599 [Branchiostoma lanceolatum]
MPNEMKLAIADLDARLQSRIVRLAGLKRSMADLMAAEEGGSFNDIQKKNAELRQELTEHRTNIAVLNQRVDDLTFSETFLPKSDLVHTYDLDHDDLDNHSSLSNSPATSLLSLNLQNLNGTRKSLDFYDTTKPSNDPQKTPLTNGIPTNQNGDVVAKPKKKKSRKLAVDTALKIVESDDSDKYEWDFEKAVEDDDDDHEKLEVQKIPVIPHPRWDEFDEDDDVSVTEKKFKRTELFIDMSSSSSHSDKSESEV